MAEDTKGISGAQWAAIATVVAAILGLCGTLAGFALNCVDKTGNIYCYRPAVNQPPIVVTPSPLPATAITAFSQLLPLPTPTEVQPFTPSWALPSGQNPAADISTNTPIVTPSWTLTWTPSWTPTDTPTNPPIPLTRIDLYALAPVAYWSSSAGPLTFGGPVNENGFVKYEDGARLEDGTTSNEILEMHPEWVNDGVIKGLYPPYTIAAGDHFRAQIGYIALFDGSCGLRSVIFQFNYGEEGTFTKLGEWTKACDYTLTSIDIDLTSMAGKTVQFNPVVLANGSSSQDWAVWVNPRIEH